MRPKIQVPKMPITVETTEQISKDEIVNSRNKLHLEWCKIDLGRLTYDICDELVMMEGIQWNRKGSILEKYQLENMVVQIDSVLKVPNREQALHLQSKNMQQLAKVNSRIFSMDCTSYETLGRVFVTTSVKHISNNNISNHDILDLRVELDKWYGIISQKLIGASIDIILPVERFANTTVPNKVAQEDNFTNYIYNSPPTNKSSPITYKDYYRTTRNSVSEISTSSSQLSLHQIDTSSILSEPSARITKESGFDLSPKLQQTDIYDEFDFSQTSMESTNSSGYDTPIVKQNSNSVKKINDSDNDNKTIHNNSDNIINYQEDDDDECYDFLNSFVEALPEKNKNPDSKKVSRRSIFGRKKSTQESSLDLRTVPTNTSTYTTDSRLKYSSTLIRSKQSRRR